MAQLLDASLASIEHASKRLRAGGLVGLPTETVYGLAGDCANPTAIASIFSVKARPSFDPLIVHVLPEWLSELEARSIADFSSLTAPVRERISHLIRTFWPGPLSLILPRSARLSEIVTGGLPHVAVRAPAHPVAQAVLRSSNLALAAPSANRFGSVSPTRAQDVMAELGAWLHAEDVVLDGGACQVGVESSVLDPGLDGGPARLLRPGGVSRAAIEQCLGESLIQMPIASGKLESPGQIHSHYAPRTPLTLIAFDDQNALSQWLAKAPESGVLLYCGPSHSMRKSELKLEPHTPLRSLSNDANEIEAASRLFECIRGCDAWNVAQAIVELPPHDKGLCLAIADRLKRAAAPR